MDCILDCRDDERPTPDIEPRELRVDPAPPPPMQPVQREDGVAMHWLSAHMPLLFSGAGAH